jgi:hypothetical protein
VANAADISGFGTSLIETRVTCAFRQPLLFSVIDFRQDVAVAYKEASDGSKKAEFAVGGTLA